MIERSTKYRGSSWTRREAADERVVSHAVADSDELANVLSDRLFLCPRSDRSDTHTHGLATIVTIREDQVYLGDCQQCHGERRNVVNNPVRVRHEDSGRYTTQERSVVGTDGRVVEGTCDRRERCQSRDELPAAGNCLAQQKKGAIAITTTAKLETVQTFSLVNVQGNTDQRLILLLQYDVSCARKAEGRDEGELRAGRSGRGRAQKGQPAPQQLLLTVQQQHRDGLGAEEDRARGVERQRAEVRHCRENREV